MRSYEAARSLFSFLGFCAWVVIIIGVIAALVGASAVGQMGGYGRGPSGLASFAGLLPGLAMSFVGFIGLALVQIGRAAVDTAEYTQQMLKIARDQLDVSKQGLNQGKAVEQGFAALKQRPEEKPAASFADVKTEAPSIKREPTVLREQIEAPPVPNLDRVALGLEDGELSYGGRKIQVKGGKFLTATMAFSSLEAVQKYVDQLGVNPNARIGGARR